MLKHKAFLGTLVGVIAVFAVPSAALAQYGYQGGQYGYGGSPVQSGWGYNPYSTAGLFSYMNPLAQYGYGNFNYNPYQSTYTGNGYGYGSYGYQGQNNPYTATAFNNYYPYLNQNCNYSFYGYQQNCQNPQASAPSITNVSGPNQLSVGQQGTWSITTSAGAGNLSTSVQWGDQNPFSNAATSQTVSNSNTFSHTYQQPGTYPITFTVVDGYGRSNTAQTTVVVTNNGGGCTSNCSGNFSATPTSGQAPLAVHFSGTVPGTSYRLDFGDGSQPVLAAETIDCAPGFPNCAQNATITINQNHTYQAAGTYTAHVYGNPANGGFPALVGTVTIVVSGGSTPTGSLTASPASGAAPLGVSFTASNLPGSRYFYRVDFGDGSTAQPLNSSEFASHTYTSNGTFTAKLEEALNTCYVITMPCTQPQPTDWTTVSTATITVGSSSNGSASFSANPASGSWPLNVTFSANNLSGVGAYFVDFGDNTSSQWLSVSGTTGAASHLYYSTGSFTATLVYVTCNGGAYTNGCTNPQETTVGQTSVSVH